MMDIVWPLLAPPVAGKYSLQVRRGDSAARTVDAKAITLAARTASLNRRARPRWRKPGVFASTAIGRS